MRTPTLNEEQARYWNGQEAAHWLEHEDRYETMLAPFTGHLLRAAAVGFSDRVLDVGCGCGASTRAAGRMAMGGDALGIDLSVNSCAEQSNGRKRPAPTTPASSTPMRKLMPSRARPSTLPSAASA